MIVHKNIKMSLKLLPKRLSANLRFTLLYFNRLSKKRKSTGFYCSTYQDNKKEDCYQPTLMFCSVLPLPVQLELLVQVL